MTRYLYLMPHGETLFNQLNKVQEACDSPLTQLGISQAHNAKRYFESPGVFLIALSLLCKREPVIL